jgi:hypothetical protein
MNKSELVELCEVIPNCYTIRHLIFMFHEYDTKYPCYSITLKSIDNFGDKVKGFVFEYIDFKEMEISGFLTVESKFCVFKYDFESFQIS